MAQRLLPEAHRSRSIDAVIARATAESPGERFASLEAFAEALEVAASPPSRQWGTYAVAGVLAVLALVGVGSWTRAPPLAANPAVPIGTSPEPDSAVAFVSAVAGLLRKGQHYDEAASLADALVQQYGGIESSPPRLKALIAHLEFERGHPREASALAGVAANECREAGDEDTATRLAAKLASHVAFHDSDEAARWVRFARAGLDRGGLSAAKEASVWYAAGATALARHERDKAAEAFTTAATVLEEAGLPPSAETHRALATIAIQNQKLDQAKTQLQAALAAPIEANQERGEVLSTLAVVHAMLGEVDTAIEVSAEGVELIRSDLPDHHGSVLAARQNHAAHLIRAARYDEAIVTLASLVEQADPVLDPAFVTEALNNLSLAYSESGRLEAARETAARALVLAETDESLGEDSVNNYRANLERIEKKLSKAPSVGDEVQAVQAPRSGLRGATPNETPPLRRR